MPIAPGDSLPDATVLQMGEGGPVPISIAERTRGAKVAIFGMPGAYTGTCSGTHLPGVIEAMPALRDKGVEDVIVIVVNDPFVAKAWAESSGAEAAGVAVLADAQSEFTKAVDMVLDAPAVGFFGRSQRYALYAENGVVKAVDGDEPGAVQESSAEALLARI